MKIRTTITVPRHSTFSGYDDVIEQLRARGGPLPSKNAKIIIWTLELSDDHRALFEFKEALDEVQPVLDAEGYDHLALDDPANWETVA